MPQLPAHILDAIAKAAARRKTYTEYIEGELSEELEELLKAEHLLPVRHRRDKNLYKLFIPIKYRTGQ